MTFKYVAECDNGQLIETWYEPSIDEIYEFLVDFVFGQMTNRQRESISRKSCELVLKIIFDDYDLLDKLLDGLHDEAKSYFEDRAWSRYGDE